MALESPVSPWVSEGWSKMRRHFLHKGGSANTPLGPWAEQDAWNAYFALLENKEACSHEPPTDPFSGSDSSFLETGTKAVLENRCLWKHNGDQQCSLRFGVIFATRSFNKRRVTYEQALKLSHSIFAGGFSSVGTPITIGFDSRRHEEAISKGELTPEMIMDDELDKVFVNDGGHRRHAGVLLHRSALAYEFLGKFPPKCSLSSKCVSKCALLTVRHSTLESVVRASSS
jgi:hypothetical protein